MNFITFLCATLKLFSLSFVPLLALNTGDTTGLIATGKVVVALAVDGREGYVYTHGWVDAIANIVEYFRHRTCNFPAVWLCHGCTADWSPDLSRKNEK